nr:unnamed protein product [Spirometra erinaceieuropaei]
MYKSRQKQSNKQHILSESITASRRVARVRPPLLAAWTVRSLLDNARSNRQERRATLVARELARVTRCTPLLSARFASPNQAKWKRWSVRPRTERGDAGVAFAIRNGIMERLPCLLMGLACLFGDQYRHHHQRLRLLPMFYEDLHALLVFESKLE